MIYSIKPICSDIMLYTTNELIFLYMGRYIYLHILPLYGLTFS